MDEILWCYHSNETSSAVLSHGTIYLVRSSNFWVCGWNPTVLPFKWNLFNSIFIWYYYLVCVLTFESANEILLCYHSDETFLAERLNSTVYSTRFFKWLFLAPFRGLYASLFTRTPGKFECPLSDFESLAIKKDKVVTLANHKRNKYMQPVKSAGKRVCLIGW